MKQKKLISLRQMIYDSVERDPITIQDRRTMLVRFGVVIHPPRKEKCVQKLEAD